jgi:hypothetical protein
MSFPLRRDAQPVFFLSAKPGPRMQPRKSAARELIIALRKRNYSVYEISETLKERKVALSPTAVREVLKEEGFAPLPRRLDEERPEQPRPTVEPVADARALSLAPRSFMTRCGGLFLFLPDLARLSFDTIAEQARLPGSKMIPPGHALRAEFALKLWAIERKSHIMSLVADPGLALFSGLNVTPKKSYLSEYSSRVDHAKTLRLMAAWHEHLAGEKLFPARSFNLDFHSVPYFGEHPVVERHFVSARSRRQPSVLVFLAQDADTRAFGYANADLRKGVDAAAIDTVFRSAPHPHPPHEIVSGDGRTYLHWAFYRNHRQCGTFNAEPYILPNPPSMPRDEGIGPALPTPSPRRPPATRPPEPPRQAPPDDDHEDAPTPGAPDVPLGGTLG